MQDRTCLRGRVVTHRFDDRDQTFMASLPKDGVIPSPG